MADDSKPEPSRNGSDGKSGGTGRMPFNLYDFFGYIFPGAYTGLMLLLISSKSNSRLGFLIETANDAVYRSDSVLASVVSATLLLIIAYSLGHIVATISHIAIDRLLVSGILGYPLERYLGSQVESPAASAKRSTSVYIFIVLLLMLIGPVLLYHFGDKISLNTRCREELYMMCNPNYYRGLGWILLGLLMLKAGRAFLASPPYRQAPATKLENSWGKWFLILYAMPGKWILAPCIYTLETFLGTERQIAPDLMKAFREKFKKRFDLGVQNLGTEVYWLTYFHLNRREASSVSMLNNWLHIYSFSRNMAAACFALLLYILYRLHTMRSGDYELLLVTYVFNFYLMMFFVFRYWMIYTTYYTKSIIRIFYASASDVDS